MSSSPFSTSAIWSLFREYCEASIRDLRASTAFLLYGLYDFWQIPSPLQDSVPPSIERDLGCIWAPFSLFFQTSLSAVSKPLVYFSDLLSPPTPPHLLFLLADELFPAWWGISSPEWGTTWSLSHRHLGWGGLPWLPDLGSFFLYGTGANGLALPFSFSL